MLSMNSRSGIGAVVLLSPDYYADAWQKKKSSMSNNRSEYLKEYYKTHKDTIIKTSRSHYKENKETHSANSKAWYLKNRESVLKKSKQYQMANKEKHRAWSKKNHLKMRFSLTLEAFNLLLNSQNNKCAICGVEFGDTKETTPNIDHDHGCCAGFTTCGKCLRGALCGKCNLGLGYFNDSVESLAKAQEYLLRRRLAEKEEFGDK